MTKADFLASLRNELRDISTEEREEALKFYSEYFDEAGEENEQRVLSELGSPERVANTIRANCVGVPAVILDSKVNAKRTQAPPNNSRTLLIILLIVITFPLWIGIVAGAFGVLVGFLATLFGLLISGIVTFGAGFIVLFASLAVFAVNVPSGMISLGVSLMTIALGTVLTALMLFAVTKGIPAIGRGIGKMFQSLFSRRKR